MTTAYVKDALQLHETAEGETKQGKKEKEFGVQDG